MTQLPYFVSEYESDLFFGRYSDPGNSEETTWEHVFERVSHAVAFDTKGPVAFKRHLAEKFYNMMSTATAIPSSPQLWNYGADRRFPRNGSSCFTGRMGDTLKDFHQADSDAEDVYVASGGFGLLLDEVRPRGCKIKHCSEGAMGSMCIGGPARRIEGTTGYITGSGRARGALMLQQSIWHPDAVEFILAKRPTCRGWLDDWPTNARGAIRGSDKIDQSYSNSVINLYSTEFVKRKEWPTEDEVNLMGQSFGLSETHLYLGISYLKEVGVLQEVKGRLVPHVIDWVMGGDARPANRDWDLPMQNCNMSIRLSDEFMAAVENNQPWVFAFFDESPPKEDEVSWTKTDANGNLEEIVDGSWFELSEDGTHLEHFEGYDDDLPGTYRYGVALTTWEGIRANMSPNKNQWRDTDYARFYREVLVPCTQKYTGRIMARQVWNLINENAWNHADPGVVFSSTYERFQPVDTEVYGPRLSNPCSEYVNSAGGSCNLISVNLRRAVEQVPYRYMTELSESSHVWVTEGLGTEKDWMILRDTSAMQAYLDEVHRAATDAMEYIAYALEYNEAPVEYIHRLTSQHFRTVGVGVMGLAEALMYFHIEYGSRAAECFAAATMSEVALACWEKSFELAMVDGWMKPKGWSGDRMAAIFDTRQVNGFDYRCPETQIQRWANLVDRVIEGEYASHTCVTSVAPTGTISMIAKFQMSRSASNGVYRHREVTSGIEPPFFWGVARQDSSGNDTNFHDLYNTPEHNDRPWMKTAMDVTSDGHVLMQAAVTAFCCMSVSKTINLVEEATIDDVANGYMLAWRKGVPGTSLYRDNCKPMQVLTALECPSGECTVDLSGLGQGVQAPHEPFFTDDTTGEIPF